LETQINFNTRFIEVASGEYPLTFQSIKAKNPLTSFASEPTAEQLAAMGYEVVKPIATPAGDVVTEGAPVLNEDGTYEQVYVVRAFNAEEVAQRLAMKQSELNNTTRILRDQALNKGAPFDFGGAFGVQHIQMRDGDRANVIGLRFKAEALLAAASTDMMGIRTFENVLVPLTASQFMDMSWKFMSAFETVMGTAWHYEDLIKAAVAEAELPALPETFTPAAQALAAA
jgi:hypothetical protein